MKKVFKVIPILLFIFVTAFVVSSCSDDDSDSPLSLIGSWAGKPSDEQKFVNFYSDGTGKFWSVTTYFNGESEVSETDGYNFTYVYDYENKEITMTNLTNGETETGKVLALTKDMLVIQGENDTPITYYRQ